jgi:DNA-binding transcriptional MocR family regulator
LFVWVELPSDVDTGELLRLAIDEEQLVFIPGHAFAVNGHECPRNSMRLNFSNNSVERLADGVARLARVLKRQRATALVEKSAF